MLKRFISYYKPHIKLFSLDLLCASLIAIIDLFYPMITRKIINEVIPARQLNMLIILAVGMLLLYVIKLACDYFVNYWGHIIGVRMQYDMRKDVFGHLQTLPFKYFDDNKTGSIMSRIVNDLMEISELAHHGPEDLLISIVMFVGSFIVLSFINLPLTLILFAFIPVVIWFAISKRKKMSFAFKEVRKKISTVNAQLENSISGVRVAKSFTNEEYEIEKFNEGNNEFKVARADAYKYMAQFLSGIHFMLNFLNVVMMIAGGLFFYYGKINAGDLFAFFLYISLFMNPVRRLSQFIEIYQSGMAGFERFCELMDIEPEVTDEADAINLDKVIGNINFENVTFKYDENKTILSNISLNLDAGKTLALVGPSGGGKTTLCHLLPRFYEITDGNITVDGHKINDIKIKSLRKNIGLVQQEVFLFTGTIRENILYGRPDAKEEEIIEAAKNANIHDFINGLPEGYDTFIGERGVKLSGGQKQRISIARVFLKNPPILILDEATSALDNASELIIQKSLQKLSEGRTTIVVAHRLSTIKNADEIVVLTDKGVEEKGTHEELLQSDGIYEKLYNAQFRGYIPDNI